MLNIASKKEMPRAFTVIILLSFCILYSLALFYFDEGRHSLEGLLGPGNPGTILFYFFPMLGLSIALYFILKRFTGPLASAITSSLLGPPAGIALILGLFRFTGSILSYF